MSTTSAARRMTLELLLAVGIVSGVATPERARAQSAIFVGWPAELASRAPALADSIARDFGERPRSISFGGRDTIHVLIWNPAFWHDDMKSRVFPMNSVPDAREAALHVAEVVWKMVGRDAKLSMVRVEFMRVIREATQADPTPREIPAQEVSGNLTPWMLEAREEPMLGISQREGGMLGETARSAAPNAEPLTSRRRFTATPVGRSGADEFAIGRAALADSIRRELGEYTTEVRVKGRDTIDALVWNPGFLNKGDTVKDLPAESLPAIREEATRYARYIRDHHARAGINVIRITFRRDWRERVGRVMLQHPAQDVSAQFTREQLETGKPETVELTIVQR